MSGRAPVVLTSVEGRLGHLRLNRPERINALNLPMVQAVSQALTRWASDDSIDLVLIDGAGPRGLCAGGDIRQVYDGIQGEGVPPTAFWAVEYAMNAQIAHYPKPVVAFMDGIVFGGGVGISAHAQVRIVTQRSQVAMPETAIGLCPDVGALYLLARAPGLLGVHCALTGARLNGPSAVYAGLADFFVTAEDLPELAGQLQSGVLPALVAPQSPGHPDWMDSCYRAATVEDIIAALRADGAPAAAATASMLCTLSPTALKVTLEAIRRAASMTLAEVLDQDLRVCSTFLAHPDFAEGIRAKLIDRDQSPSWVPARLSGVERDDVLAFFAPIPRQGLQ